MDKKGNIKKTFIISYDLPEGADYSEIHKAIKSYGTWAKITLSTWSIVTENKAKDIRDHLIETVPQGSRLFVVKSGSIAAWRNVICSNNWLKKNL